ncbi:hypothetical protein [Streptomyces sp. NPDC057253]|uniref:hypothetical protein n=1 Tax=Streptomyces sp. NPDC057253 TaxID=3346069 RepID=UPI00363C96C4
MAEQKSSQQAAHTYTSPEKEQGNQRQQLPQPLRAAVSVLGKVPGAGTVGRVAEGTLDRVAAVSPRGRRLAVYAGAGVLGVAGIVEWPIAVTGAAVAWLTQSRPEEREDQEDDGDRPTPRVLASTHGTPSSGAAGSPGTASSGPSGSAGTASSGPSGSAGPSAADESREASVASSPSDKLPVHETASPTGPRGGARGAAGDRR